MIDQHAADERYRLEQLIERLRDTKQVIDPVMNIQMSGRHLSILWKRREALLQWGIDITVERSGIPGTSGTLGAIEVANAERQWTGKEMGTLGIKGAPQITKDLGAGNWKQILLQYVSEEATQLPSLLTEILASKACRSVPSQIPW